MHIQTNYIDVVSELKDIPAEYVEQMLKAREELNREKKIKIKVKNNRKNNVREISKEINENGKVETLNPLLTEIQDIASNSTHTP